MVFVGAYLLIWMLFGGLSYLGALATSGLAQQVSCPPSTMGKLIFVQGYPLFSSVASNNLDIEEFLI
jgi:hypothetical protein